MRFGLFIATLLLSVGCGHVPKVGHKPGVYNPFPQLERVAVAPFINLSEEPTADGMRFALAYYAELQAVPGFEVVPVGVVETAMRSAGIDLRHPGEARRLAQLLDVDAVVIGAVTDYSPYYPPRLGLQVEWWAANPAFYPIPPGYGLPWGTKQQEFIPEPLIFEAEFAQARAQLEAQTPAYQPNVAPPVQAAPAPDADVPAAPEPLPEPAAEREARLVSHEDSARDAKLPMPAAALQTAQSGSPALSLRKEPGGPIVHESKQPVLRHTNIYDGTDPDFTASIATYTEFRDDERFSGVESYLARSEDFIRFCCHRHIAEMLSARGGAQQTRLVWRSLADR